MRDRRDVSSHPRGQSKEYGFVTFTHHEASLAALRNINNNPEIFTVHRVREGRASHWVRDGRVPPPTGQRRERT